MSKHVKTGRGRHLVLFGLANIALSVIWSSAARRGQPETLLIVAALFALVVLAAWVGLTLFRCALRPRRDRDAFERLQLLLDRTCVPDVQLVAVIGTEWANQAGQAATTVEVKTGRTECQWFPLVCFPRGSLVLVRQDASGPQMLDWMPPDEVHAAHRHRARRVRPRHWPRTARPWSRRGYRRLITEVEAALRHGNAITLDGPSREVPRRKLAKDHRHDGRTP